MFGSRYSRIRLASFAALLGIAGCTAPRVAVVPISSLPTNTRERAADLQLHRAEFASVVGSVAALAAFRRSCPALLKRRDQSGLTQLGDWDAACAAAVTASDASAFFASSFTQIIIGTAPGFATGYFEPEIAASRSAAPGFATPFFRRPTDLVEVELGDFAKDLQGRTLRGRIVDGRLVPYPTRGDIMAGALAGKDLEIAFAADPFEAFFLEIQGSGRLRLPDGSIMRIGYAGQNGRGYVAIGKVLREAGELPAGGVSMESILSWLRANPTRAPAMLAANPSIVFFREIIGVLDSQGPIGAMNIAVTPRISVAADPAFIPLGAPVRVITTLPGNRPLATLMVVQDTGGAIKGPNRIDLFMGSGATARADAGAQGASAEIAVLLPVAAAARLLVR